MLLIAHVGHYAIWLLYAVPVLIVSAAIVRSYLLQRRQPPAATGDAPEVPEGKDAPPAGGREGEVEHVNLARRPPLP